MIVEDFTSLQRGAVVPLEGKIDTCPRCGRNGIEEHPQCGDPYFLHIQASLLCSDGMICEPIDRCDLTPN